jgi:thiamine biosynthesis lipoprotein
LVAASGDIRVSNPPPGRAAWKVGIGWRASHSGGDSPTAEIKGTSENGEPDVNMESAKGANAELRFLEIANAGVSTSGDSFQRLVVDGNVFSHIIDPESGMALRNSPLVTVIAERAITADALASAVNVMGAQAGIELAESLPGVEAAVCVCEIGPLEQQSVLCTTGFPKRAIQNGSHRSNKTPGE